MCIIADLSHIPIQGGTPMKKGYVIPLKEKFAYGSGDLAVNLAFDSVNFYMLWFIVTVAGISPGMAGAIFFIPRVWYAITDYYMGRISDYTSYAVGRRRRFFMCCGLSFSLLAYLPLWQELFFSLPVCGMLSQIIIWVVFQIIRHLLLEEEGHILCLVQFRWGSFSWHYGLCHRLVKQVNLFIISVFIYYLTRPIQSFLYLTEL